MAAPRLSYFAMIFILLLTIISFVFVVFDLSGVGFVFELALLLSFMFLLSFGVFLVYHGKRGSWGILGAVLVVLIFDTLIIALFRRHFTTSYALTTLFALIGLIVVLYSYLTAPKVVEPEEEKQYDKSRYYYPFVDRKENVDEEMREEVKQELKHEVKKEVKPELKEEIKDEMKAEQKRANITTAFTPGKYIASKKANKFHSPKCDWAQRIDKENQIWFNSKEEARAKGFEADRCVE